MQEKKYTEAMKSFLYADDKDNYSKAKGLLRKEQMKTWFPIIFLSFAGIIGAWLLGSLLRKIIRYCKGEYGDDFYNMR